MPTSPVVLYQLQHQKLFMEKAGNQLTSLTTGFETEAAVFPPKYSISIRMLTLDCGAEHRVLKSWLLPGGECFSRPQTGRQNLPWGPKVISRAPEFLAIPMAYMCIQNIKPRGWQSSQKII